MRFSNPNPSPQPWRLAWIAAVATLVVFILLQFWLEPPPPHVGPRQWHASERAIEGGVGQLTTFALALSAFTGAVAMVAWVAIAGLGCWVTGFVITMVYGPCETAGWLMLLASLVAVALHLSHGFHAVERRWARLLRPQPVRRFCLVLVLIAGGLFLILSVKHPNAVPQPEQFQQHVD